MNDIIEANIGLVYAQLHKFNLSKDDDAVSIGYEALYMAVSTFDDTKGIKLSTYATVCIYNALGSYLRTKHKTRQLTLLSYNTIVGDNTELLEFLPDCTDIEEEYIYKESVNNTCKAAQHIYNKMNNKTHKAIVLAWCKSGCEKTTSAIAKEVCVSQSYVSQVLSLYKARIRKYMEESK